MTGTLINVGAVVAGTLLGRAIGHRLPEPVRETTMHAVALLTLVIGVQMVLPSKQALVLLGSLFLGAISGELLRIETWINRFGAGAERRLAAGKGSEGDFARGFVTTSILFCVGPVTILGCFRDGLTGDYSLLAVKSTLDGVAAIAFSATLGWGVMLSAVTVLLVQGSLTLAAEALQPVMKDAAMQREMFAAGGVMMLGLGIRLLRLVEIRVANLLPALAWAPFLVWLGRWLGSP